MNAYDILKERGFLAQCNHEEELHKLLGNEKITFYIGYDPTADSLTVGHFLTLMAMGHLQRAGHRPITLMGTGTGMIGDPTDKTDMRRIMSKDEVMYNISCFKKQISKFIEYDNDKGIMAENGEWLSTLNYIDFLRDIGVYFSVNRMLSAESYKTRLESGLTLFEFNYMVMQAYDYLQLYKKYNCRLQMGGDDQWSNILAGTELIRKIENTQVYALTIALLTNSEGTKMGKTMSGAIWLDPKKTTPYELFQYFRNVADQDVIRYLKLLTFLPMEDIKNMETWTGSELNRAKEILAYEITNIVHGKNEADNAKSAASAVFGGGSNLDGTPTTDISDLPISPIELLRKCNLAANNSEVRRLIDQGGLKINEQKITSIDTKIQESDFKNGYILIQKGKKVFHRVRLV